MAGTGREVMGAAAPDLSVIVATRNRATILPALFESLFAQRTGGAFTYEVLIVDNGSTDQTAEVVRTAAARGSMPVRYLYEERSGKPYAVNAGLRATTAGIIALTDDDIVADPDWLAALWRAFQETDAEAIGGRVLPLWVDGRPEWMTDRLLRHLGTLGCVDFGPEPFIANGRAEHYWWVGGNIGLRRRLVERFGGYNVALLRGQDADLLRRYQRAGIKILYEPRAVVQHRIGRERLTPEHFRAWNVRQGRYAALMMPWQKYHLLTIVPWTWYRDAWRLVAAWWRVGGSPERFWERLGYECRLRKACSVWWNRARLWPRGCLAVFAGRSIL